MPAENWDVEDVHIPNTIENLEIHSFKNFLRDDLDMPHQDKTLTCSARASDSHQKDTEEKMMFNNHLEYKGPSKFSPSHTIHKKPPKKDVMDEIKLQLTGTPSSKINSKFFKTMIKFYLVKKFIRKLRHNTIYRQPKCLRTMHFSLINDWTYFPGTGLKRKKNHNENPIAKILNTFLKVITIIVPKALMKTLKQFSNKSVTAVIHPTSNFRLTWDLIQMILNIFYFIFIPLSIGFSQNFMKNWTGVKEFSFGLFLLDIFINFNTAFYDKGELMISKMMIFKYYFNGRFFYDLFSLSYLVLTEIDSVSLDLFLIKLTGFLFIFRIYNLSKAVSRFEEFLFTDEYISNIISFIRLISGILLFSHWSACLWVLLGEYEYVTDSLNWISYYKADNLDLASKYVYSLYFIVVVMNTVGFGDITPNTIKEKVFIIGFILFACMMFAYMINRIGMILHNIHKSERELKRNLNVINGFMKIKNIDFNLKIKVRNYLEYKWQVEKHQNLNETQQIIDRLSSSLKEELLLNANGVFLKDIPFLNNNFSEEALRKMVYEMKEINLTPGDIIFRENDIEDQNLYIVRDGEIELFIDMIRGERKIHSLKILKKSEYFGELSLFSNLPRSTSAKSLSFSSLFVIKQETFIKILQENQDDYERFCLIKDQINLYNNFTGLGLHCWACKNLNHDVLNCPLLHLVPCVERILEKYNYSVPNKRHNFRRKTKKVLINPLKNIKMIQIVAHKITKDLFEIPQESYSETESLTIKSFELEQLSPNKFEEKSPLRKFSLKKEEKLSIRIEEKSYLRQRSSQQKEEKLMLKSDHDFQKSHSNSALLKSEMKNRKENPLEEEINGKSQSMQNLPVVTSEKDESLNAPQPILDDIDTVKSYMVYFPDQNVEEFIEKINKLVEKKQKKMRTMTNLYALMRKSHVSGSSTGILRIKRRKKQSVIEKEFFQKKKRKSTAASAAEYLVSVFKRTKDSFWGGWKISSKIRGWCKKVREICNGKR